MRKVFAENECVMLKFERISIIRKFLMTANSQQPTANSQQPTANSQQPTANNKIY
jgi:hypothetical protein